ncbi:hypothetical protein DFH09DRAFT_1338536 [Mycena vulgaris]|nr:hypothetical protein DFH09DRAFT_1338536 [Mycena vulgaris]
MPSIKVVQANKLMRRRAQEHGGFNDGGGRTGLIGSLPTIADHLFPTFNVPRPRVRAYPWTSRAEVVNEGVEYNVGSHPDRVESPPHCAAKSNAPSTTSHTQRVPQLGIVQRSHSSFTWPAWPMSALSELEEEAQSRHPPLCFVLVRYFLTLRELAHGRIHGRVTSDPSLSVSPQARRAARHRRRATELGILRCSAAVPPAQEHIVLAQCDYAVLARWGVMLPTADSRWEMDTQLESQQPHGVARVSTVGCLLQ